MCPRKAFEMDMCRRMMRIRWMEHRTNNSILNWKSCNRHVASWQRSREGSCNRPTLAIYAVRADNYSCTHVLHGTIAGNFRCRGRPRRRWTDDIKQLTGASVAECVQCVRDQNRSSALVSVSATSDPQS